MVWEGMFFGPFMMLLVFGLFVALVVMLVRWILGGSSSEKGELQDRSLVLLRERFAKGEIDATEFEDRKRQLQG